MSKILLNIDDELLTQFNVCSVSIDETRARIDDCSGETVLIVPREISQVDLEQALLRCDPPLDERQPDIEKLKQNIVGAIDGKK